MKIFLIIIVIGLGGLFFLNNGGTFAPPPKEITAPHDPVQKNLTEKRVINYGTYILDPLAEYSVEALVLSKKAYHLGRESEVSKYDLALGWGPMSSAFALDHMKITQSNRFYYYKYNASFPLTKQKIIENSANKHIITDDREILKTLADVKKYDVVSMKGYLVKVVSKEDGWFWNSSTTRMDTGHGACEVFYVTEMSIK